MASKNKKTVKKKSSAGPGRTGRLRRQQRLWVGLLVVAILLTAYQVLRTNHSDGLELTEPRGSVSREAELDQTEIRQETELQTDYDQRFIANTAANSGAMQSVLEAGHVDL
jgi:hypothetical protein